MRAPRRLRKARILGTVGLQALAVVATFAASDTWWATGCALVGALLAYSLGRMHGGRR